MEIEERTSAKVICKNPQKGVHLEGRVHKAKNN